MMSLSPEERADKVIRDFLFRYYGSLCPKQINERFFNELKEHLIVHIREAEIAIGEIDHKILQDAVKQTRREALEEAMNIIEQKIKDEMEFAEGIKGQAVFQSQCAIDMAVEIKELIRARIDEKEEV